MANINANYISVLYFIAIQMNNRKIIDPIDIDVINIFKNYLKAIRLTIY
jgi:hypothetical protein